MDRLVHDSYIVEIETPHIYVDNKSRRRSGHMTHALARFSETEFIDFNSNCSAIRCGGHSPYGYIEYRLSGDSGNTYSEVQALPYSVECIMDGIYAISVEKSVACDDGTLVAFGLRNSVDSACCEPWHSPTVVTSKDKGKTWSEAHELCPYEGRIYDALYRDGVIYVLEFCNKNFFGTTEEHVYRLFVSLDNGSTFQERCVLPINGMDHSYASMLFDAEGNLHVYAYCGTNEQNFDHIISADCGRSFQILEPCFVRDGARNPQIALIDGVYILHGRAIDRKGFMIYSSLDGQHWDNGVRLAEKTHLAGAFYSNNLNLKDENGEFLLVQFSETYTDDPDAYYVATVNVMHTRIRIRKHKEIAATDLLRK